MTSTILTLIGALLLAVTVHEAAHALALRNMGIPISRAGLGLPFPPIVTLRTPWWGFDLTLSPWLVGAYVEPDDRYREKINALPYRDQAWYLNAGIIANLILGFALTTAAMTIDQRYTNAGIYLALTAATWLTRRWIAAYLLPAAAIPAVAILAVALTNSWSAGETGVGYAGLPELVPAAGTATIGFVATISLAVALMNTLPLYGLDNGKVGDLVLHRWTPPWVTTAYRYGGITIVLILIAGSVASDLWSIWGAVS